MKQNSTELIVTHGFYFDGSALFPKSVPIVVRVTKTGNFVTMSLANEEDNVLIQIPVLKDVRDVLRGAVE